MLTIKYFSWKFKNIDFFILLVFNIKSNIAQKQINWNLPFHPLHNLQHIHHLNQCSTDWFLLYVIRTSCLQCHFPDDQEYEQHPNEFPALKTNKKKW